MAKAKKKAPKARNLHVLGMILQAKGHRWDARERRAKNARRDQTRQENW